MKKLLAILSLVLLLPSIANTAITLNSQSSSTTVAASISHSHTVAGTDRAIIAIVIHNASGDTVTNVTYAGVASTRVCYNGGHAGNMAVGIYLLVAPTLGTNTLQATNFSTASLALFGLSLSGVDQKTPVGNTASALNIFSGSPVSTSITLSSGSWAIDGVLTSATATMTPGAGQTEITSNFVLSGTSMRAGASWNEGLPASMSWSWTTGDGEAQCVIEVKSATGTPPPTQPVGQRRIINP